MLLLEHLSLRSGPGEVFDARAGVWKTFADTFCQRMEYPTSFWTERLHHATAIGASQSLGAIQTLKRYFRKISGNE
jgi:hypothetical protein